MMEIVTELDLFGSGYTDPVVDHPVEQLRYLVWAGYGRWVDRCGAGVSAYCGDVTRNRIRGVLGRSTLSALEFPNNVDCCAQRCRLRYDYVSIKLTQRAESTEGAKGSCREWTADRLTVSKL